MIRDTLVSFLRAVTPAGTRSPSHGQREIKFDGGTQTDQVTVNPETGLDASLVSEVYPATNAGRAVQDSQLTHLRALVDGDDTESEVSDLAREHAELGVTPSEFAATYAVGEQAAVSAVFDRLEHRLGDGNQAVVDELRRAEDELKDQVETVYRDVQIGLEAYAGDVGDDLNVDDEDLLDGLGLPVFMIDADNEVAAWNSAIEDLTQVSRAEALGSSHASEAFYPDGRRAKTLADKVVEAPRDADVKYGIDRVSQTDEDLIIYQDESTMVTADGVERHIAFNAAPIFENGSLVAVVETVQDRTTDTRRHEGVSGLVETMIGTMSSMAEGDLSARAKFEDEHGVVDDELLAVLDQLNALASRFEELATQVDTETRELSQFVTDASSSVNMIDDRVGQQSELLTSVANEMENFSANMQEVAASSDQVASAAEQAQAAADTGLDSSEGAREATDEVIEMSDDLVETVSKLESQMDEIEDVVEVIAEVADQTNLLALNANIEAARAGDAGSGFEVVANEVKELANETRTHTTEIADRIEDIQSQANETMVAVEESNQQVQHAGEEIEDALLALEEIADAVDEAATGVTEVAEANDEQATTVEQVMATIEDVRDGAQDAGDAIDEIVEVTENQSESIERLSERVGELTNQSRSDR